VRLLPSFEYHNDLIYCDSYDKLVIAVGSVSSTHGVPGLEHCFQLKTVGDAQAIRRRILGGYLCSPNSPIHPFCIADNFETASLPSTSEEERKRLLSFVVCGGGPTGVETAAVRIFVHTCVRSLTPIRRSLIYARKILSITWVLIR